MLTIIHGNDIVSSRKFFLQERQRFPEAAFMQESEVNLTMLAQLLAGGGFFEDSKTLFIEHFLSERKKSSEKEFVITYLVKAARTHDIFLWEGKELERGVISSFKDAKISLYKLPSTLFALMDAIKPGNGKHLIELFHKCLETTEVEMVFFMLVRQFRLLLAVVDKSEEKISEVARMASWQRSKLENQAKLLTRSTLIDLYHKLFKIETLYKTGGLSSSLIVQIDFFLVNL